MLVDPTPQLVFQKIPLDAFLNEVRSLPPKALRDRARNFCEVEIEDFAPLRIGLAREFELADEEGDLPDVLILGALKLGVLEAFAYHPMAGSCYALRRFFWSTFTRRPVALCAIDTGTALLPLDDLPPQSIDCEMANRALFVAPDAMKVFLNLRPPAVAALEKFAARITSDHVASGRRMKKSDFIAALIQLAPGCSKERAAAVWAAHAPKAWRRPGRPSAA